MSFLDVMGAYDTVVYRREGRIRHIVVIRCQGQIRHRVVAGAKRSKHLKTCETIKDAHVTELSILQKAACRN